MLTTFQVGSILFLGLRLLSSRCNRFVDNADGRGGILSPSYLSTHSAFTWPAGSGLGLSIIQWIARAHGGEVHVESKVGEGTTFEVRFNPSR